MTDDLVAWYRAQLDEDERVALAAADEGRVWEPGGGSASAGVWADDAADPAFPVVYDEGRPTIEQAAHIARHDPARVLAEVAAKRRIIDEHAPVDPCDAHDASLRSIPCETLRLLASVYAGRPGWRSEWAPDEEASRG